ncbi:hypothetical protein HPB51_007774 [Rhipicephalus microplus]|uniref:Reverse transcriptase Ty1/copia-type domain-containing protein n=1 Tax=Rhipicephalus microplus TaxID=6941 RepID=A0A9J6EMX0_RHIMP|nr:hypothetical protein HPB51_007774 [Rhipicephalus microplus]
MTRSKANPCIYTSKKNLILGVYVDDWLMIAEDKTKIVNFKTRSGEKFDARDSNEARHILSILLKKNRDGGLTLHPTAYAEDVRETFGIADAKTAPSPLDPGCKYQRNDNSPAREDHQRKYRKSTGALLYLIGGTRPDLAFAAT